MASDTHMHAAEIARLSRELEEARKLIRELVDDEDAGLVWTGTRLVCAYCSATDRYGVEHDRDCPIERARRALAADTEVKMGNDTTQYTPAEAREPTDRICGSQGVDADDAQANTCDEPPCPPPDGYVWCKTIGDGWRLMHTTAGIDEWAGIVESGLDSLHGVVLRYEFDAFRAGDGAPWLRYGCEMYPVAEWREIVSDLCRFHEPERAGEYERAIRELLDFVEMVFGKGAER